MTQAAPIATVHTQTSINVRSVVLPRAQWDHEMVPGPGGAPRLAVSPQKGTWYGHVVRGKSAHDVVVVALLACPACGGLLFLSHSKEAAHAVRGLTGMPVPVAHQVNHLGKVAPDIRCQHQGCGFHRRVYLDRWLKTKALYAIAYVEGDHGSILIDYTHAVDRREARFHFGPRRDVRIIDMAPAIGHFLDERTGRLTAD